MWGGLLTCGRLPIGLPRGADRTTGDTNRSPVPRPTLRPCARTFGVNPFGIAWEIAYAHRAQRSQGIPEFHGRRFAGVPGGGVSGDPEAGRLEVRPDGGLARAGRGRRDVS